MDLLKGGTEESDRFTTGPKLWVETTGRDTLIGGSGPDLLNEGGTRRVPRTCVYGNSDVLIVTRRDLTKHTQSECRTRVIPVPNRLSHDLRLVGRDTDVCYLGC